ncbi:MAG: RnfABCDGE type electron transport complex subunit A [Candidatus Aureabacteria bacterium]|jgi:electron transport complex protein RnfA|nr:RnfABCDGE type electron transport complex subunit A [Candidatus Auribacterota bacterium]NLW93655.1 RnfABCDGE type electron transport complex subunit A [Chlamydiota bacterium]HOE27717.1 RnfABCDGE type electron transport complex subunit A [bacterium]HQM52959.1 RnfABCDGE type electron transport complex subunit A [bacterium]
MDLFELFSIFIGVALVHNFIFCQFLGLCPYIGVTERTSSAMGMGMAVIFVMVISSAITWAVYQWLLVPLKITYLYIIAFILVIAAFVQLVEMFLQKSVPALYRALGIYLPLITTNCAVLGVVVLNMRLFDSPNSLVKCVIQGFGGGAGFMLAMLIMAGIRERLELADVPAALRGMPIALITAGLTAIAFLGFAGLSI